MKLSICFVFFIFSFHAFSANPFSYIRSYFKERKFVIDNDETYKADVCEKYLIENQPSYFITCKDGGYLLDSQIDKLDGDVNAIEKDLLKTKFKNDLKKVVDEKMQSRMTEVETLVACIEANACPEKTKALISGLRNSLPKLRALMAQKDMPGKIYSPTRPVRLKRNISHKITKTNIKEISDKEFQFIKGHSWDLEDKFSDEVKREHPEYADSSGIVDSYVTKKFEKQNKIYQNKYSEMISNNPLLSLVNLRGDESEEEIINEALRGLKEINTNLEKTKKQLNDYDDDELNNLILHQSSVKEMLKNKDSKLYCDLAQSVKEDFEWDELKSDIALGSSMLIGGGACALTFGVGCVLGVAVTGEAIAINMSYKRKQTETNRFYSSESSEQSLNDRNYEHQLTMFLAPLSFVGEGAGTVIKSGAKFLKNSTKGFRRYDFDQRKAIDNLEKSLGANKNIYLNQFNPHNMYKLSKADQIYLSGIITELKKAKLTDVEIKQYIKNMQNDCKGDK